jgi:hypothetical protein
MTNGMLDDPALNYLFLITVLAPKVGQYIQATFFMKIALSDMSGLIRYSLYKRTVPNLIATTFLLSMIAAAYLTMTKHPLKQFFLARLLGKGNIRTSPLEASQTIHQKTNKSNHLFPEPLVSLVNLVSDKTNSSFKDRKVVFYMAVALLTDLFSKLERVKGNDVLILNISAALFPKAGRYILSFYSFKEGLKILPMILSSASRVKSDKALLFASGLVLYTLALYTTYLMMTENPPHKVVDRYAKQAFEKLGKNKDNTLETERISDS